MDTSSVSRSDTLRDGLTGMTSVPEAEMRFGIRPSGISNITFTVYSIG